MDTGHGQEECVEQMKAPWRRAVERLQQETASREELKDWRAELVAFVELIDAKLAESEGAETNDHHLRDEARHQIMTGAQVNLNEVTVYLGLETPVA
jgi:hypothetical protein